MPISYFTNLVTHFQLSIALGNSWQKLLHNNPHTNQNRSHQGKKNQLTNQSSNNPHSIQHIHSKLETRSVNANSARAKQSAITELS